MLYTKLDGIDKAASRLVYGTTDAASQGRLEEAFDQYEAAYGYGFRIFDTANGYGKGEDTLGRWLEKSGHRDDVIILDKGCNPCTDYTEPDEFSAETIFSQINRSLDNLRTDHVELYLLHRDDTSRPVDEIVEALNRLHSEGKIKHFGGSNWSLKRIMEANNYAEKHGLQKFTICSPHFSYARLVRDPWGASITLTGDDNRPFRDYLRDNQMPVFNYSSLARGFLSGKYKSDSSIPIEQCIGRAPIEEYYAPENVRRLERAEKISGEIGATVPQIAMAWLMKQSMNLFPLTSPSGEKHVKEVVDALDIELTAEQLRYLDS
ncbi:MAG: aldo/keto reductase [Parasporobacterium sp.]|nr:aldo/keto reductase [Parasporobacterium sp.]